MVLPTMCVNFRKIKHGIKKLANTRNANFFVGEWPKNWLGERYRNSVYWVFRHCCPLYVCQIWGESLWKWWSWIFLILHGPL